MEGSVTGEGESVGISSTCCADVVPLPKEKPATVITKHIRPILVTLSLSELAKQVST